MKLSSKEDGGSAFIITLPKDIRAKDLEAQNEELA